MRRKNQNRLIILEKSLYQQQTKKRVVCVVYDASSDFNPETIDLKADVVFFLPDNGRDDRVNFKTRSYITLDV